MDARQDSVEGILKKNVEGGKLGSGAMRDKVQKKSAQRGISGILKVRARIGAAPQRRFAGIAVNLGAGLETSSASSQPLVQMGPEEGDDYPLVALVTTGFLFRALRTGFSQIFS